MGLWNFPLQNRYVCFGKVLSFSVYRRKNANAIRKILFKSIYWFVTLLSTTLRNTFCLPHVKSYVSLLSALHALRPLKTHFFSFDDLRQITNFETALKKKCTSSSYLGQFNDDTWTSYHTNPFTNNIKANV